MFERHDEKRWLWGTLLLSSVSICAVVFAFWELVENQFFHDLDYVALHYLYISRGIASSLLLAVWAAWYVLHQRRQAEEELRRSRERYRGLLELSPAAVTLYDRNLRVAEWNQAAERLYGYDRAAVVNQPLPTLIEGGDDELATLMDEVERGDSVFDHETLRHDSRGNRFQVQLSLAPFVERGQTCFLEVTTDIRERVRLREALVQLEKLTTMGKMAAGTAHHLNTPLASMLLRVQMMRDVCQRDVERPCSEGMNDHLDAYESSLAFCQQFVRRLLDFARPPALQQQPEAIQGLIDAVLGFLWPSFTSRQVEVTTDVSPPEALCVLGDRNQLETLLLILLSNALDAVPAGGRIRIVGRRDGASLDLTVSDNGAGIRPEDQARVFEPFFTTKPTGKGTGLGLSIAQNIVTEHGGAISLTSQFCAGTAVRIRLPLCGVQPDVSSGQAARSAPESKVSA